MAARVREHEGAGVLKKRQARSQVMPCSRSASTPSTSSELDTVDGRADN
ncbi:hypothetical protein [Bradyrhizobium sp. ARR65]